MAEVRPIEAVHYDLGRVPSLEAVTAPPYDVITPPDRKALVDGCEHNVVELDLPAEADGGDPYEHAAETMSAWLEEGVLVRDDRPAIWAYEQDYTGPDGQERTRRGLLARIKLEDYGEGAVRPHERTQPGPKEDRLRLTRATAHSMSPIFVLHGGQTWDALAPVLDEPWGEASDPDGTTHRVWRVGDPDVHAEIAERLAGEELLIADGHHRYETARTYAEEIGGDGLHRYTLACLVSLEDPGLTVFATHRLLTDLAGDESRQAAIRETARELFEVEEVDAERIVPDREAGPAAFGYMDSHHRTAYHFTLRDPATLDRSLDGHSDAYRTLDAAALEAIFLRGALGMSTDDIAAKRGLAYDSSTESALERFREGDVDAGFFLRPTPVEQVRAVAAAGETMPPKSTYFFPKLLTGIVFNPLR